jgi:hypothetical protein
MPHELIFLREQKRNTDFGRFWQILVDISRYWRTISGRCAEVAKKGVSPLLVNEKQVCEVLL